MLFWHNGTILSEKFQFEYNVVLPVFIVLLDLLNVKWRMEFGLDKTDITKVFSSKN